MKHLLLLIFMLTVFTSTKTYAQDGKQDRIKSLKIGYITQELELTSKEAENFWPVYNEHQDIIRGHHMEIRKLRKNIQKDDGIDAMTNAEAEKVFTQFIILDKNIKDAEIAMYKNMKSILPAKKILKLHSAEKGFNRKILKEIRKRREGFRGGRKN